MFEEAGRLLEKNTRVLQEITRLKGEIFTAELEPLKEQMAKQRSIIAEMGAVIDPLIEGLTRAAGGEIASAPLAARTYRLLRQWDEATAAYHRDLLHEEAVSGNPLAAEVLELLSDDPWWTRAE